MVVPQCVVGSIDLEWEHRRAFNLEALAELARRRPSDSIEVGIPASDGYFSATTGPGAAPTAAAALKQIETAPTWVVLKDLQDDPGCRPHIEGLFDAVAGFLAVDPGTIGSRRCHAFISSHGARTPLHADDCVSVLVQVRGGKELTTYDMGRRYFSPRLARLSQGTARVFTNPRWVRGSECHVLSPGEAVVVPWNQPHEARTLDRGPSISLNVGFEDRGTARSARIAATNDALVCLGFRPVAIGVRSGVDALKALMGGTWFDRSGALRWLDRRWIEVDRG